MKAKHQITHINIHKTPLMYICVFCPHSDYISNMFPNISAYFMIYKYKAEQAPLKQVVEKSADVCFKRQWISGVFF